MEHNIIIPNTDLKLSPLGLGTVDAGVHWGKDAADQDLMFGTFMDQGGNVIDCAHVYADWVVVDGRQEVARAERVTGDWMQRNNTRNKVVLIPKAAIRYIPIPAWICISTASPKQICRGIWKALCGHCARIILIFISIIVTIPASR